jgi:spore cortex biosynthesis protein YabQ
MSGQIINEGIFLLYCLLSGICITIVYDCLRIFRRVRHHGTAWIAIEDLFFWLVTAIFLFYVLYKTNNGVIRWFSIAGVGIGMLIYKYTIGEHLVEFMSTIIKRAQHLVSKVLTVLFRPVKRLYNRALGKWKKHKRKMKKQIKKKLTGNIKKVKITLCKHKKQKDERGNHES